MSFAFRNWPSLDSLISFTGCFRKGYALFTALDGNLDSNLVVTPSPMTKCSAILVNKKFVERVDVVTIIADVIIIGGISCSLDGVRWTSTFSLHLPFRAL